MSFITTAMRKALHQLDPEVAHTLIMRAASFVPDSYLQEKTRQAHILYAKPQTVMGIDFINPIGLAAGFDKNAECINALASLGFGFIEVGTIVPKAQSGNPKPRIFRIPEAQAIINRMGFNSKGVDYAVEQLKKRSRLITVGVNIGKNYHTPITEAASDYIECMKKVYPYADYIAVNISSPNTPGLRELSENPLYFKKLITELKECAAQLQQQHGHAVPLVIKLSPDESDERIKQIAHDLLDLQIDGVIISNTTLSREGVNGLPQADQIGGLSGQPLAKLSCKMISEVATLTQGKIPIIGAGGILSGKDAQLKIEAGASLVQLYTGFIYKGPELINEIFQDLSS